jgi:hypothetical protein
MGKRKSSNRKPSTPELEAIRTELLNRLAEHKDDFMVPVDEAIEVTRQALDAVAVRHKELLTDLINADNDDREEILMAIGRQHALEHTIRRKGISEQTSAAGKNPRPNRRKSEFTDLLGNIVSRTPDLTNRQIFYALRNMAGPENLIVSVTDTHITWQDDNGEQHPIKRKSLPTLITHARQAINSKK